MKNVLQEVVHLIFYRPSKVWNMLHHGPVGASLEETKINLTLTLTFNLLLPIVFHNNRHFSHVTKTSVFKNRGNLRRKDDSKFYGNFMKNHFRHLNYIRIP